MCRSLLSRASTTVVVTEEAGAEAQAGVEVAGAEVAGAETQALLTEARSVR